MTLTVAVGPVLASLVCRRTTARSRVAIHQLLMAAAIGGLGFLSIPHSILANANWNALAYHFQSILCATLALLAIVAIGELPRRLR